MPLTIVHRRGRHCPTITCDYCGEPIRDARDGNAQWPWPSGRKGAPLSFTHKRCCHAFEAVHPETFWGATELGVFMIHMANGLKLSWSKAARDAARLEQLA